MKWNASWRLPQEGNESLKAMQKRRAKGSQKKEISLYGDETKHVQ
jgi:hypothetical protein